jgi:hypothetical protein
MNHDMAEHGKDERRRGWLWMLACCLPMIIIIVLIVLGFATSD